MKYNGKTLCVGDHIDTDAIIPARFLVTTDPVELGSHCMEGLDPEWVKQVKPNATILVAGRNFGCGSSREQAPLALKHAGVSAVLAQSFARIFYRNAINLGIPAIICDTSGILEGDGLSIDLQNGTVTVNEGRIIPCQRLSGVMRGILDHGGLVNYINHKGDLIL